MPKGELFDVSVESYKKYCPLKKMRWLVPPKKQNLGEKSEKIKDDLGNAFQLNGKQMVKSMIEHQNRSNRVTQNFNAEKKLYRGG